MKLEDLEGLVIKSISEYTSSETYWGYDGILIKTDKGDITILISNGQSCCESWGYEYGAFLYKNVSNISVIDKITEIFMNEKILKVLECDDEINEWGDGGSLNVVFVCNTGTFWVRLSNIHNGYYSHPIEVSFTDSDNKEHSIINSSL